MRQHTTIASKASAMNLQKVLPECTVLTKTPSSMSWFFVNTKKFSSREKRMTVNVIFTFSSLIKMRQNSRPLKQAHRDKPVRCPQNGRICETEGGRHEQNVIASIVWVIHSSESPNTRALFYGAYEKKKCSGTVRADTCQNPKPKKRETENPKKIN